MESGSSPLGSVNKIGFRLSGFDWCILPKTEESSLPIFFEFRWFTLFTGLFCTFCITFEMDSGTKFIVDTLPTFLWERPPTPIPLLLTWCFGVENSFIFFLLGEMTSFRISLWLNFLWLFWESSYLEITSFRDESLLLSFRMRLGSLSSNSTFEFLSWSSELGTNLGFLFIFLLEALTVSLESFLFFETVLSYLYFTVHIPCFRGMF